MSTGLAQEMQKGSGQLPVVSGQWSVASSCWQVFGGRSWVLGFTLRFHSREACLIRRITYGVVAFYLALFCGFLFGQTAPATKVVALRCGSLFDAHGDSLRKNVFVVIEAEKIKETSPHRAT